MTILDAGQSKPGEGASETSRAANAAMPPSGGAALAPASGGQDQTQGRSQYKFVLYVAGNSPNSERAVANLRSFCAVYIPDRHELEIVDTMRDPLRTLADGVLLTPMLLKVSPAPSRRIVGSLNLNEKLLQTLGWPSFP